MKVLLVILFNFILVLSLRAGDVRTYNMHPGTCMYIQGAKVCAMETKAQYIVVDGSTLPLTTQQHHRTTLPILATIQGRHNICECDYSTINREGYTVEKTVIDSEGKKKTTYIKVAPDVSACRCQVISNP